MYTSTAFQNGIASQNISFFVGTSSVNVKKYISEKCKKRRIRIGEICFSWNFPKNHCKIANSHNFKKIKVTRASIATFTVCRSLNVGKCYAYTSKNQDQLIKKDTYEICERNGIWSLSQFVWKMKLKNKFWPTKMEW